MKEAAGEANMTVVTIIIIAAVVAIGTPIVTGLMNSTKTKAECLNNGKIWVNGKCQNTVGSSSY